MGLSCADPPSAAAPVQAREAVASSAEPTSPVDAQPRASDVEASGASVDAPSDKEQRGLSRLGLPQRGDTVPPFVVTTTAGKKLSSAELVGRPFVVVFFTSWCPVCEKKMPVVSAALQGKSLLAIGVAMDDEETFANVPGYAERHGIAFEVVQGQQAPGIVDALDPPGSFPVLFVVGKDGKVVDVQIGLKPDHGRRLEQALAAAVSD
jgi:peroxiredoxin